MREPVLALSWLKRTVLRLTALYSFTGTVTRPKLMAPVQIERGMDAQVCPRDAALHTLRIGSCAQRYALEALAVEVLGRQPGLEGRADRGPLTVEDGVPGRVPVAALDHEVLAEDALEAEPEALGRTARAGVGRVALPLQPPVAEVVERVAREQVDRLGRPGRALQRRAEPDVADLDDAVGGLDAQVAGHAERAAAHPVDDGEEQRV